MIRWFLDVNGVLNGRDTGWKRAPRRGYATADGREFKMRWEPRVIDFVRETHLSGRAVVTWCTTWCAWADELERLWDLPRLPRAFAGFDGDGRPLIGADVMRAMKIAAVRLALAEGDHVVWTDDHEVPEEFETLHAEMTYDDRALLIAPDSDRGLRPEHLEMIDVWLRERS